MDYNGIGAVSTACNAVAREIASNTSAGGVMKTPMQNHRLYGFDDNEAVLKPAHERFLQSTIIPQIRQGKTRLVLWGHTDRSGPANRNMALGRRRMEAVKKFIVDHLPANLRRKVTFTMYNKGETEPLRPGTPDGTRSAYDRAVRIGAFTQPGIATIRQQGTPQPSPQGQLSGAARRQVRRLFAEAERYGFMRSTLGAVDHATLQSIRQSKSGRNLMKILNSHLRFVFAKSVQLAGEQGLNVTVDQMAREFRTWVSTRTR
jgi:hypothetical protein